MQLTTKTRQESALSSGYLTIDAEGGIKQWGLDNRIYLAFKPDLPQNALCTVKSAAIDQNGSLLTICWANGGTAAVNILTHEVVFRFNIETCIKAFRDIPALEYKPGEETRCCRV